MSGASGKVPAAIHVSPEALAGGPLGKVRDGDVDPPRRGRRHARGAGRRRRMGARASVALPPDEQAEANGHGLGRELFAGMRRNVAERRGRRVHLAVNATPAAPLDPLELAAPRPGDPGHRDPARRRRGAAGARAGRRRRARARSDAAHAGRRWRASRRSRARCPRPSSAPARCAAPPTRRPRRTPAARFAVSPGYTQRGRRGVPRARPAAAARRRDRERGDAGERRRLLAS